MSDLELRRRRAAYRAAHRGTKEMDWLLGRYCEAHLATMDDAALTEMERFLAMPDPEMQVWIMSGSLERHSEFHPLVERIRAFHGLAGESGAA